MNDRDQAAPDFRISPDDGEFVCPCGCLTFTPRADQPVTVTVTVRCPWCGVVVEVVP